MFPVMVNMGLCDGMISYGESGAEVKVPFWGMRMWDRYQMDDKQDLVRVAALEPYLHALKMYYNTIIGNLRNQTGYNQQAWALIMH